MDVGLTHTVHLWLDEKRIVDFLLAIIELVSLALMDRRFLDRWVTLSATFW